LDIVFQNFNIKFNSDEVPKIIKAIRECYMALHPYHPEHELILQYKLTDKKRFVFILFFFLKTKREQT